MNKPKLKRLSVKIILILFAILAAFFMLTGIMQLIIRALGVQILVPKDEQDIRGWLFYFTIIVMAVMGFSILIAFSYAINKTVVSRIKKLKEATGEVIKGNFGVRVETKGNDELSELTETFNKMAAELEANEYLSKDFVRNISHEFKTPLSVIKAYGELVDTESNQKTVDKKALKEYAKIIMEESDRLAALSKSILQLSLLDATTIIKKEDTFCPAEQIRGILRLAQKKWSEKKLTLDLHLEEFTVTSNEQLLYQVWQNLIGNAVKFARHGGKVTVILKKSGEGIFAEIADDGEGIKEEDKSQIFNQFFVGDQSRNTEGSGLGLPIAKKIIGKLGGEIGFESRESQGTKFFISL